jgi:hypothetical protein
VFAFYVCINNESLIIKIITTAIQKRNPGAAAEAANTYQNINTICNGIAGVGWVSRGKARSGSRKRVRAGVRPNVIKLRKESGAAALFSTLRIKQLPISIQLLDKKSHKW